MITQPSDTHSWVGSIITARGTQFDIINPHPEQFDIYDIARSLSHVCRFNGHLPTFYSIAEHSVRVADWLQAKGQSPLICLTGLLHDAAEAYVGDMVRPLKQMSEMSSFRNVIEPRVARVLHETLGGVFPHPDIVHDSDRALYDWEVANVRTGIVPGWPPADAFSNFLSKYESLRRMVV
jgi:hypothetical protein